MDKRLRHNNNTFICLDDITLKAESPNPVIYNPNRIKGEYARRLLHDLILQNVRYDLSNDQLVELTNFDANHLDEFVVKLRSFISQ